MIKSRLEEKWIDSQQRNASLDDELTQLRAHVDLFHLRIQEEHEEKDKLKVYFIFITLYYFLLF